MKIKCPSCGNDNYFTGLEDEGTIFCSNCNKSLVKPNISDAIEKGEMAKKSIKKKPKKKSLDALIIIFNQEFSPKEPFVNEILIGMSVRDKPYKYLVTEETPIQTIVNKNAQDPHYYMAMSFIQFREMVDDKFNRESIEVAEFQGTKGINGVILSHWSDR